MRPSASQSWPLVAPDWLQNGPGWLNDIGYDFYKSFIFDDRYQMYIKGLGNTLLLTLLALLIGVALGVVVSLIRVSWDKNHSEMHGAGKIALGFLNAVSKVYLTIIRGTPMMVQILIWNFVVFSTRNKILVGMVAMGINAGAYISEIIRGGLMSVDPGQSEAGRSLGLSYLDTMRFIVIPQAFKNILPSMGNELVTLFKDTSLVNAIGAAEMTYYASRIGGKTFDYMPPLLIIAAIYLVFVMGLTWLQGRLERRLRQSERR